MGASSVIRLVGFSHCVQGSPNAGRSVSGTSSSCRCCICSAICGVRCQHIGSKGRAIVVVWGRATARASRTVVRELVVAGDLLLRHGHVTQRGKQGEHRVKHRWRWCCRHDAREVAGNALCCLQFYTCRMMIKTSESVRKLRDDAINTLVFPPPLI